tara:strand:+ start:143 stop:1372 length:1230 start_codon:yes stop_codon:yes gene_type:complete
MKTGPDIVTDGLVFGYDTHDYSRFYNGPATTNHLLSLTQSWGNTIRTNGKAVAGTEEVNIPTIGKRTVKYVEYYNNYNNGNDLGCCPNLFNYHSGGTVPLVGNQSYTYSIVYKHTGGYTHPNFMYRYRYKSDATYIGEGGLHSTARRTHLGDGWYHAWGSWTTDADANYGRFYSFLYNYGTDVERFYVAAISLVKNNTGDTHLIIPPNLLLEPNTSISTTQSLIDLKKTTNINVSNMSFDSTGQPTFDGTDDYIPLTSVTLGNGNWSMEFIANAHSTNQSLMSNSSGGPVSNAMGILSNKMHYKNYDGVWRDHNSSTTLNYNQIYHIVFVNKEGVSASAGTMDMYINGEKDSNSGFNSYTTNGGPVNAIGRSWTGYFDGDIHICKRYTTSLSNSEVKQNYNSYKTRFGI